MGPSQGKQFYKAVRNMKSASELSSLIAKIPEHERKHIINWINPKEASLRRSWYVYNYINWVVLNVGGKDDIALDSYQQRQRWAHQGSTRRGRTA
jgi:hypothetical protein